MNILFLGVFILVAIAASEAVICTSDTECGSNECCYIRPMFLVASKKRQFQLATPSTLTKTGVCESYRNDGDRCSPLETMNGHCGCASKSCQWVDEPVTVGPGGRRSEIYHPNPGANRCV